jgi:hypothetical protein
MTDPTTNSEPSTSDTDASARRWRPRRNRVVEAVLVIALAITTILALRHLALTQRFTVDESRWIATSRYFWITFLDRDVFGEAWRPNYIVLTHPPVARYVIGFGLWLQGWSPDRLNGRFDNDHGMDWNRRAGNIPSRPLLDASRRSIFVFAVGATLLMYPIGRLIGGPLAGAAAVLLALGNPLLAALWTRALAESLLSFFLLLAFLLAVRVARLIDRGEHRIGPGIGLGIALGLATATKLTGVLGGIGLALFVVGQQAMRWWADRRRARMAPWVDAAVAAVLAFVLANPLLYPDPIVRSIGLFQHRRTEMQEQAIGTPRLAVPDDLGVRSGLTYRRVFEEYGTVHTRTGLPLDLPLATLGLATALVATWRSVRRRTPLGPRTLLLCWTVAIFVVSTVNLGFISSHYFAPQVMISVLLEALALATLPTGLAGVVRLLRRRAIRSTVRPARVDPPATAPYQ